jgi:GNAT superfamily N-acetyltransferase
MSAELISLSPGDPDPAVGFDRGVKLTPAADRAAHGVDRTLLLVEAGSLVARCSCWWTTTPQIDGRRVGVIGHYAAADEASSKRLLDRACEELAAAGAPVAVGPMDGTTWRRYRFIVERGSEPPFFLEPDNPDDWPAWWMAAGFARFATYTSALTGDPGRRDPRTPGAVDRLRQAGVSIRPLDPSRAEQELARIFRLSLSAFSRNVLYTPIGEEEFVAQYRAVMPYVKPELVLLAERGDALVGFMFALPDLLEQPRKGAIETIILKTIAVDPAVAGMGLGGVLMDVVQERAHEIGFRRAIHALIHETNVSGRLSARSARTFRRYALFAKPL